MNHEAAIRDLESEKSRLKDKVVRLEEERGSLQNKSQALEDRQRQQILSLEKVSLQGRGENCISATGDWSCLRTDSYSAPAPLRRKY